MLRIDLPLSGEAESIVLSLSPAGTVESKLRDERNAAMTSWKDEQVLIVGGGIGGLTAALALARQGIAVQVIEPVRPFNDFAHSP